MLIGIILGLLLAAADVIFLPPRKRFLASFGQSMLVVMGVSLIDAVIPYTLPGYFIGLAGVLVLYGLVYLILAILPEVEEL